MTVETAHPIVWSPSQGMVRDAALTQFRRFAVAEHGAPQGGDYEELWRWSIERPEGFWSAVSEFCDVKWDVPPHSLTDGRPMPYTGWFPDARLNYVAQVFAHPRTGVAVVGHDERGGRRELTWEALEDQVSALAATLAYAGVEAGDRVVGYLSDRPEAIVAFLAAASLGAIWAGCGTDLSAEAAASRLSQLEPVVLVAAMGHHHRGEWRDRTADVQRLHRSIPSLRLRIEIDEEAVSPAPDVLRWADAIGGASRQRPVSLAADHPLWVVFTSGTTGPPKGIVHSHAGVVVEHLKTLAFHLELHDGDQFFWYTTLNWMMWNLRVSGLLRGATVHCFDGTPTPTALWKIAARGRITHLGVSPGYLAATRSAGVRPAVEVDGAPLRFLGCTGSVLTEDVHRWIVDEFDGHVQVSSTTGGTDVVTGFAGSVCTQPVRAGEIAVRCLGVDLQAWSTDGHPVVGEIGELVITRPMPSMPVAFWNDPDGRRYREAYFDAFPDVWRHGDWITLTEYGSVIVHGRSDATLNRHGIRMGSADICEAAEHLSAVSEALVVGIEEPGGGYWMPMFVTLAPGHRLDDALADRIKAAVRERVSARHVPDDVIAVPGIPHTHTGKKLEVPVKNILLGRAGAVQYDAVDRPELLEHFRRVGAERRRLWGARS